jgi:uncharacterized protein YdhG (YjbR/CyaY superfamily)
MIHNPSQGETWMAASASPTSGAKPDAGVRAYLALVPPEARRALQQLRDTIRSAAPRAVEGRSYGILGYKLDGRALLYCAGWKQHVSLYPITAAMRRVHGDRLETYEASKGTLRFPLTRPLPVTFIRRLVKTRLAELRAAAGQSGRVR